MAYMDNTSQGLNEPSTSSLERLVHEMKETTFDAKKNFYSYRKAYNLRSEKCKLKPNENKSTNDDAEFDIWKLKPLDFNWKLYCQPHPPKKNSREAIKPWKYTSLAKSTQMLPSIENKMNRLPLKIVDDFNYFSGVTDHKKKQKFISNLRFVSPLSAKIQAAKSMSYREGFGPYASKSTPTFRDTFILKNMKLDSLEKLGLPDFHTRFEHDPYNLKFLRRNLSQVHGLSRGMVSRDLKAGLQMGDFAKTPEPKFDKHLVLPKMYPNQDCSFTRHPLPLDIYWDLVLTKFDSKLKQITGK